VYTRFGEFLRVDTERALARMRDSAVAALIEARATPRFGEWANRQLVALGKEVASEAVQVQDPGLRADILRAYGKTHDLETTRLLIAFAASERATIRVAARQALVMLADAGLPSLRDAYHKATTTPAPEPWPWQRVAQELFAAFDRQRLSALHRDLDAGLAAEKRGDLNIARAAFDRVLAHDPSFERGALMAPTYFAWAEQQADANPLEAALALRRAERLAPDGPLHDRALSLRYTLDARSLLQRGIIDQVLVQRARQLDPDNPRAAALADDLEHQTHADHSTLRRYLPALVILLLALLSLLAMTLRHHQQPTNHVP
jgi:tetratricopeptide (TPR) repeat protein